MGLRSLTNWNDPIFRKKSKVVERFDERLWMLLDDMHETLKKVGGYGCAAIHVGVLRRVVVVNDKDGVIELVNPEIIEKSEELQVVSESSIAPGAPRARVTRPKSVAVSASNRHGNPVVVKGEGFLAATFCHEIDHLEGVLFTDKVNKEE